MKLKLLIAGIAITIITVVLLVSKVPYSFAVTAKIYPARKWVLTRDTDGSLVSTLYNHKEGGISNYRSYKIDNGDVASMSIIPSTSSSTFLQAGDSVAILHSALIDERLNLAKSQLSELQAMLQVEMTGLKHADVERAKEELASAQQQLILETLNYQRISHLYEENAVALAEFELVESSYKQAQVQVKIAENALVSASTGAKKEQISYTLARIASSKKELDMIERQKASHTLVSPIAGKADFHVSYEEVISIEDTTSYVLHFPIKLTDKPYVSSFSKVFVTYPAGATPMEGQIVDVSNKVEYMSSHQLVFAKAELLEKADNVHSGMFLSCKVVCDEVTLLEYLRRMLLQVLSA